jgi:hypothetical protein
MEMRPVVVATALLGLVTIPVTAPPAAGTADPARAAPQARVDFNDDGFADLAVGAPSETVGARGAAGAVNVYYAFGGPGGAATPGPAFTQGAAME